MSTLDESKETAEGLEMFFGDQPRELPSVLSGFTPAPDVLIRDYGYITALVWGKVWRYCQMSDGVCRAAIDRIAEELKMSYSTIIRHIKPLCDNGYLYDSTPDLKNKPHIYSDTGKIRIRVSVEAQVYSVTKTDRQKERVTLSERTSETVTKTDEESIKKESKKVNLDSSKLSLDWKIGLGLPITEEEQKNNVIEEDAIHSFERELGFGSLSWDSNKEWEKFKKFVVRLYKQDNNIWSDYANWREGDGKYKAMTNNAIRRSPQMFIDTGYPTYEASKMYRKDTRPEYKKVEHVETEAVPNPYQKPAILRGKTRSDLPSGS